MKINVNKSSFVTNIDETTDKKQQSVPNASFSSSIKKFVRVQGNLILKTMFILMVAFYIFSFSSNYIFAPKENDLLYTPVKQDNLIENTVIQIYDWKYSKAQNMMEVNLTIDDETANLYTLSYTSKARMTGNELQNLSVQTVYQSSSYVVIFIKDIPENYNEILLSVDSENKTTGSNIGSVSLYTNRYKATKVNNISKKTGVEYQIDRLNIGIENFQEKINLLQKNINKYNKNIKNATNEIEKLRDEQQYLTTDEITESEGKIKSFNSSILNATNSIKSEQDKIRAYQQKLDEIKLKIKEIKGKVVH